MVCLFDNLQLIRPVAPTPSMFYAVLLALLLASSARPGPLDPCPKPCLCVSKSGWVWCTGGRYDRLPKLPAWTQRLSWTGLRVTHFSLSHLPRAAISITFRGLRFDRLHPENSGIAARTKTLDIEGCCGQQFPNFADFQNLAELRYLVHCPRGSPGVDISNPVLSGIGRNLKGRELKKLEISACVSVIDVPSVRQIFRYGEVILRDNRLRDFSSGSFPNPNVKKLNVSGNMQLTQMDIGEPGPVALKELDVSNTRLPIQGIAVHKRQFTELRQRGTRIPLDLQWLCERFPKLVHLNVGNRASVQASGVGKCKYLGIFIIDGANQKVIPDLSKTSVLEFAASRNRYRELTLSTFNKEEISKIDVSFNLIQKIVINSTAACVNLKRLTQLDLSYNNLTTLSYDFLKCLPEHLTIQLDLSGNPMQDVFAPFFQPTISPGRAALRLNMSNIPSIRSRGIFPAWIFSNFAAIQVIVAERNNLLSLSRFLALLRAANLQEGLMQLHLADNRFSELSDRLFLGFVRLEVLNLARNDLHSLGPEAFAGLEKLMLLDLAANKLTVLGEWPLMIRHFATVALYRNNFRCTCDSLHTLSNSSVFDPRLWRPKLEGLVCAKPAKARGLNLKVAMHQRTQLLCAEKPAILRGIFSNTWVVLALVLGVVIVALVSSLLTRCLLKKSDKYWIMATKYPTPRHTLQRPVCEDFERVGMMTR